MSKKAKLFQALTAGQMGFGVGSEEIDAL